MTPVGTNGEHGASDTYSRDPYHYVHLKVVR